MRVVNLASPADSLLLGKPTWEAAEEAEAQNDPTKKAHAGGVRFEKNSREYQTLLDWINGARLPGGSKSAGSMTILQRCDRVCLRPVVSQPNTKRDSHNGE